MFCEVYETVDTEDYIIKKINNYGFIKLPQKFRGKELLVIYSNSDSTEDVVKCKDDDGVFVFRECVSQFKSSNSDNLSVKKHGLTGAYIFVCVLESSDVHLYLRSNYTVCKTVADFNDGSCNLILPNTWIKHRVVIIPFHECFIKNGFYSFDTVECMIHEANLVEYKVNKIYMNRRFSGFDCIVSHY